MNSIEPGEYQLPYSHVKCRLKLSCCYFLLSCFPFLTVAQLKSKNGEVSWTYRSPEAESGLRMAVSVTPAPGLTEAHGISPISNQHNHHYRKERDHAGRPKDRCGSWEETCTGEQKTASCFPF